jgi:hypothetical protein
MTNLKTADKELNPASSIFVDCEHAYHLIKEGKEKQAEEMFPWGYYLVQKYLYLEFNDFSKLLAKRLSI